MAAAPAEQAEAAEEQTEFIQLISCAVLKYSDNIAVFTKIEDSNNKRMHGKKMIWVGGHLQIEDVDDSSDTRDAADSLNFLILMQLMFLIY